jgi:branched-chain amino acid transport system permease protein
MLLQLIFMGLVAGCCYALIALAMVIIYKTSEILNFAQGELAMFSTFIAFLLLESFHLPPAAAFPAALAFAMLLGALCELLFLKPARERERAAPLLVLWSFTLFIIYLAAFEEPGVPALLAVGVVVFAVWMTAETFSPKRPPRQPSLLGLIIITLGLEMILYGLAGWIWGATQKDFPSPIVDTVVYEAMTGDKQLLVVGSLDLVIFSVSIFLMTLLFLFFRYMRVGIAMKATAQNLIASRLMGIRTGRIFSFTWALSCLIGAVAGLLIASGPPPLDPNLMLDPLLKGFAAAVLGGMNSLPGAVLGGCILGIVENLAAGYLPAGPQFKSTIAFLVIVLILCFRPSGLLGHHYVKKV